MTNFNKNTFLAVIPTGISAPQAKVLTGLAETLTTGIGAIAAGAIAAPVGGIPVELLTTNGLNVMASAVALVLSPNWKGGADY